MIPYQMLKVNPMGGFELNDSLDSSASHEHKLQTAMLRLNARGEAELAALARLLNPKKTEPENKPVKPFIKNIVWL